MRLLFEELFLNLHFYEIDKVFIHSKIKKVLYFLFSKLASWLKLRFDNILFDYIVFFLYLTVISVDS
jgi:hypothetical protein